MAQRDSTGVPAAGTLWGHSPTPHPGMLMLRTLQRTTTTLHGNSPCPEPHPMQGFPQVSPPIHCKGQLPLHNLPSPTPPPSGPEKGPFLLLTTGHRPVLSLPHPRYMDPQTLCLHTRASTDSLNTVPWSRRWVLPASGTTNTCSSSQWPCLSSETVILQLHICTTLSGRSARLLPICQCNP